MFKDNGKLRISILLFCIVVLFFTKMQSYLLFHTFIETFFIITAFSATAISINTFEISDNSMYTFIGIAYGFVGIFDFLYMISYKGYNAFNSINTVNLSTQYWIGGRYVEAVMIFYGVIYFSKTSVKKIKIKSSVTYLGIFSTVIISIIALNKFPVCYIEGYGLTNFKIYSEYIIIAILMVDFVCLYKRMDSKNSQDVALYLTIILICLSEASSILYTDVYGTWNFIGYIFKFISYYCLYVSIVKYNLRVPYKTMFAKISSKNEILNRNINSYKQLFDSMPMGIIVREKDKIIYANNEIVKLLGYENRKELCNKSIIQFIAEEYRDYEKQNISLDESTYYPLRKVFLKKNGEEIYLDVSSVKLNTKNKSIYIVLVNDNNEKIKMERIEKKLQNSINREKAHNEYLSNLSHEILTPVNVIYSSVQLQKLYLNSNNTTAMKKCNSYIEKNCMRIQRMANNIMDMTAIEMEEVSNSKVCWDIVKIIQSIIISTNKYLKGTKINVNFLSEENEIYVFCDKVHLERVILNLISNAIKFRKEDPKIAVKLYKKNKNAYIVVKDNGIGIEPENLDIIFEPYEKADSTFERIAEGLGVGLPLCKAFIEADGGKIDIISGENEGTEIKITFKIDCKDSEALEETAATSEEGKVYSDIDEKVKIEFSDIYFE